MRKYLMIILLIFIIPISSCYHEYVPPTISEEDFNYIEEKEHNDPEFGYIDGNGTLFYYGKYNGYIIYTYVLMTVYLYNDSSILNGQYDNIGNYQCLAKVEGYEFWNYVGLKIKVVNPKTKDETYLEKAYEEEIVNLENIKYMHYIHVKYYYTEYSGQKKYNY